MKIIKNIIIAIIGLVVLVLAIGLVVDEEYAVEREVTINKPKSEVFDYVLYLKNQNEFSVWAIKDPNMKKDFKGTDGTIGFISAWESDNPDVGKGEQEIMAIIPGERIDYELRFFEPFMAKDKAYMTTESIDDNSTLVQWGFDGKMSYPMNLMLLVMNMEEMLGGDLKTGLENLKSLLENKE